MHNVAHYYGTFCVLYFNSVRRLPLFLTIIIEHAIIIIYGTRHLVQAPKVRGSISRASRDTIHTAPGVSAIGATTAAYSTNKLVIYTKCATWQGPQEALFGTETRHDQVP